MNNLKIVFFLFIIQLGFSQKQSISFEDIDDKDNFGRFRYLEIKGHTGGHVYTGSSLEGYLDNGYGSIEIRYGWQPSNPDSWSSEFGYPSYGLGWYSGYVGDYDVFGNPNALFGFINFPLSSSDKRNVFQISPAVGLAYNLNPYDETNNPDNDAIGAPFAVYFNVNLGAEYSLTRETDLLYGIDFTHFSNGRTFTPNYGLNMFGINLGLRYMYNSDQKRVNDDPYTDELLQARYQRLKKNKFTKFKEQSIEVYAAIGTVQNEEDRGTSKRFTTFSGVVDYRYKFSSMSAVTAGMDYFYDESLEEYSNKSIIGVHAGYDFMFYKFTIRVQGGVYLTDDKGKEPTYIRAAIRYDITDWMFAQAGLKTQKGSRADWIEWGVGFRPFKW